MSTLKARFAAWACLMLVLLTSSARSDDDKDKENKDKPKGNRYALLVGVKQYDPTELNNLQYAEDDVVSLAKVLEESGYRKENIMLMTQVDGAKNARALPLASNIQTELELILKGRTKDDVVLVAFAGHGVQFSGEDENFFCPLGTKLTDRKTMVSLQAVSKTLESSEAGLKLMLVDACRNDPQTSNSRSRPEVKLNSSTRPPADPPSGGVAAFYSCSEQQKAYEDGDLKHGVFFHFVIAGLRGGAVRQGSSDIFLGDLERYVNEGVEPFVRSKLGKSQLPQLITKLRGAQQPLVSYPKEQAPSNENALKSFQGIDPRYLPGAIGPTDRVNLPNFASKDHKIKRVTVLRQVTNHRPAESAQLYPDILTISPNGQKIAWFAPQKGIYTANWDGSDEVLAVPNKQGVATPVANRLFMSPDGGRIYWQSHGGPIMRANADGSDQRVLVKEGAEYANPRLRMWGYRIFYGTRGGIYSIDTEGVGDLQPILTQQDLFNVFNIQGLLLGEFDISERGTELVARLYDPDLKRSQLFAFPVGGDPTKDLRLLIETKYEPTKINITPDGRQVFFGEYGASTNIVNWDGTGLRELPLPPSDANQQFRFSPDGQWISYFVPDAGSILTRLDGSDRVEPYQTGIWQNNNLAIFHSGSPIVFSKDFRRFAYIMNFYTASAGPRQIVVGEINPAKATGLPELTNIEFSKIVAKDPSLPNHTGTIRVQAKKGTRDIERIQFVVSPTINLSPEMPPRWNSGSGWYSLDGDHQLRDDGKTGDEKADDGIWSTNLFQPGGYATPGKYALRLTAHEKTTFRGWEKASAVIVDVDGFQIK